MSSSKRQATPPATPEQPPKKKTILPETGWQDRFAKAQRAFESESGVAAFRELLKEGVLISLNENTGYGVCCCSSKQVALSKGTSNGFKWDKSKWRQHWSKCLRNPACDSSKQQGHQSVKAFFSKQSSAPKPPPQAPLNRPCLGLTSPAAKFYANEHILADSRGGFSPVDKSKLLRTLFPYKYDEPVAVFSKAELLNLANGRTIDFSLPPDSSPETALSPGEAKIFKLYEEAHRRWKIQDGDLRAADCSGWTDSSDQTCLKCKHIANDDSLKRRLREAQSRQNLSPSEAAEAEARRIKHTPHSQYAKYSEAAQRSLAHPELRPLLEKAANKKEPTSAVFFALERMASTGQLEDKAVFVEMCQAMVEMTVRSADETGNAMKGMRYSERFLQFATLLRGYGAKSSQQYGIAAGELALPSFRTLRYNARKSTMEVFEKPVLCVANFQIFAAQCKRLGYSGPVSLATDCSKLPERVVFTSTFAPMAEEDGKKVRVGGHLLGSTLPFDECYVADQTEFDALIKRIKDEKLLSKSVRLITLRIPLPGAPTFVAGAYCVSNSETGPVVARYLSVARQLAHENGLAILSLASDSASIELSAKEISFQDRSFAPGRPIVYQHGLPAMATEDTEILPFKIEVLVFDGKPIVPVCDVLHARKSTRNFLMTGAKFPSLGFSSICFYTLVILQQLPGSPLLKSDVFNTDRQDDGAAGRLFSYAAMLCVAVFGVAWRIMHKFEAFFVFNLVFGDLFDAHLNRSMSHVQRCKLAFRARLFLMTWQDVAARDEQASKAELSLSAPFMTAAHHFLAPPTFKTLLNVCDSVIQLVLAHREYFPSTPLVVDKHHSDALEHLYGHARQLVPDFDFTTLISIIRHLQIRAQALSSGAFKIKTDRKGKQGYTEGLHVADGNLSAELKVLLTSYPCDRELDQVFSEANDENTGLWKLLGVDVTQLRRAEPRTVVQEESPCPAVSRAPQTGANTFGQTASLAAYHIARLADLEERTAALEEALDGGIAVERPGWLDQLNNPIEEERSGPTGLLPTFVRKDGSVDLFLALESRRANEAISKVRTEQTPKAAPSPTAALSSAVGQQRTAALSQTDDYYSAMSAFQKNRITRWRSHRSNATEDVSLPSLPIAVYNTLLPPELARSAPALAHVKSFGLTDFHSIYTGSILALGFANRAGDTVLALGRVACLYQLANRMHQEAPVVTLKDLSKLSYISVEVFIPGWRGQKPKNDFTNTDGGTVYWKAHIDKKNLFYLMSGADLVAAESEPGTYRLNPGGFQLWCSIAAQFAS